MDEDKIVVLKDENGKNIEFTQLMTFEFEESLYVAITPVEEVEGIKNGDVMLLQIREDEDGEDVYLPLDDEQKLAQVWEEFEELYYEE